MNTLNLNKVISIMQRAALHQSLYMPHFQSKSIYSGSPLLRRNISSTQEELHACGNKACLAGHIAISPEFHADGGSVGESGIPEFDGFQYSQAIEKWLEFQNPSICYDLLYNGRLYERPWEQVKPADVIRIIKELLYLGEVHVGQKLERLTEKFADSPSTDQGDRYDNTDINEAIEAYLIAELHHVS